MQIPYWKKLLSYLFDFHLEETGSEVNPELTVLLSKGRIQLTSANAIYSFEDLYKNFSLLFDKLDLQSLQNAKVLILGFGLGSIPIILEKKNVKCSSITGVELDEEVLLLANDYSLPKIKAPIELVCADAFQYVHSCEFKYDVVVIDVFLDDQIPDRILSLEFLERLKFLLKNDSSKVIMNTMYNDDKTKELSTSYFNGVFKKVFNHASFQDIHMNRMILNFKPQRN